MHLTMAKNTMAVKGKEVKLMPGMAVAAEVKTGKRRVIQFFLRRYRSCSSTYNYGQVVVGLSPFRCAS